jgi:pimeloyl-ACP methyl ester carboxylesterase
MLLVHGGFHGAWCWDRLIDVLTEKGLRAEAIEMPFTTFADDLAELTGAIDRMSADGTPVTVVGHSMAGVHLTAGAGGGNGHRPAAHLVYLTAVMIDPSHPEEAGDHSDLASALRFDGDQVTFDPELAPSRFYNRCQPDDIEGALALIRPMTLASLIPPPGGTAAWQHISSTYIVCTDDQVMKPDGQRIMVRNATRCIQIESDHPPFLSKTTELANVLTDIQTRITIDNDEVG